MRLKQLLFETAYVTEALYQSSSITIPLFGESADENKTNRKKNKTASIASIYCVFTAGMSNTTFATIAVHAYA